MNKLQLLAIVLPQFHPIPENDEWWGKGFTEWTNVTKAEPLFRGHIQPRLPRDLGFYDLRLIESIEAQAALAKEYGISGFCYYHYWFQGKRLLERPIETLRSTKRPDFPFCLFWANETWSRRWLGEEQDVIVKQQHSHEDDAIHAEYLSRVFEDERYIRVEGRPVFFIYRPGLFPDVGNSIQIFKEVCFKRLKVEPLIIAGNAHAPVVDEYLAAGFDYVLNFRPQLGALKNAFVDEFLPARLSSNIEAHGVYSGVLKLYNYEDALACMQKGEPASFDDVIPSVFVGWDNTPRRGDKGIIITNGTPELFERELRRTVEKLQASRNSAGLILINAWNEWAEGNYLEPDQVSGRGYLEAVRRVSDFAAERSRSEAESSKRAPSVSAQVA